MLGPSDFGHRLQLVEPPSPLSPIFPDILENFDADTSYVCMSNDNARQMMPPPTVLTSPLLINLLFSNECSPSSYDSVSSIRYDDLEGRYSISGTSSDNTMVMPSVLLNKDVHKSQRAPHQTNLEKTSLAKDYLSLISLNPIDFLKTLTTDTEIFSYQQGLYWANSQLIPELLDALWNHDQIHLHIETWIESKASTQVADGVSDEFEAAKAQFFMYSNQVTPEFVMTWPFDEEMKKVHHNMPKWNRILEVATERKMRIRIVTVTHI